MNKLNIIKVKNPFKPYEHEVQSVDFVPFLSDLIQNIKINLDEWVVSVNGEVVKDNCNLLPNDTIVCCPVLAGGGKESRKTAYRIIASIAVIVASAYTYGAAMSAWGSVWASAAASAVNVGGMLLVNKLIPPVKPKIPSTNSSDSSDVSPAYGWSGPATLSTQGVVIPVLYGEFVTGGNIIEDYIKTIDNKQYLNVLLGLCNGKIFAIKDIFINKNPIYNYHDIEYQVRLGTNDQDAIPYFDDVIINNPQNVLLDYNVPFTVTTQGNSVNQTVISLNAPNGLGILDKNGSVTTHTVEFKIEYKPHDSETWTTYAPVKIGNFGIDNGWENGLNLYSHLTTKNYWSLISKSTILYESHLNTSISQYKYLDLNSLVLNFYINHVGWFILKPNNIDWESRVAWFKDKGWIEGYEFSVKGYITEKGNISIEWKGLYHGITNIILDFSYSRKVEFSGNTFNTLRKDIEIPFLDANQYDIKITRITPDVDSTTVADKVYLTNVSETVFQEFTYPCLACLGVKALATDQLSGSMPSFVVVIDRGVFSEDDPGVIPYLVGKDSSNYAWGVIDLLTNTLYGANWDINRIDIDTFEKWAQYCEDNDLKCNILFDSKGTVWDACLRLASMANGVLIRQGTTITVAIEDITERTQVFSVGNIVKDSFKISYLPKTDRANYLEVTYWDKDNNFERTVFPVYTSDWSESNDIKQSLTLYGVTNYEQALKIANRILRYNIYLTHECSFEAEIDAVACTVGNVIGVQHDIVVDTFGGRIVDATYNYVQIDKKVDLEAGKNYGILIRLFNDELITKTFTATTTETTDVLPIIFSTAETLPQKYDVYAFGVIDRIVENYRVTKIGRSDDNLLSISGINYDERIYTDENIVITPLNTKLEYNISDLKAEEQYVIFPGGTVGSQVKLMWTYRGSFVRKWHIFIQDISTGKWVEVGTTVTSEFIVKYNFVYLNTYKFAICYEDWAGNIQNVSDAISVELTILGKGANPSDVENFVVTQQNNFAVFSWDHVADIDINYYQIREGSSWAQGNIILDKISKNSAYYRLPTSGEYTFWIKAVDKNGKFSINASKVILEASNIEAVLNILAEQDDVVLHNGTMNNLVFVDSDNYFALPCSLSDIDVSSWVDTTSQIVNYDGNNTIIASYFSKLIDLTKDVQCSVSTRAVCSAINKEVTDQTYPNRTDQTYPNDTDTSITATFSLKENLWLSTSELTASEIVGSGDGTTTTFEYTLTNLPVDGTGILKYTIGTVNYTGVDDGLGNISGTNVTGTIDYFNKILKLTFTVPPIDNIVFNYNYFQVYNDVSVVSDNIRYIKNNFNLILDSPTTLAKVSSFKTLIDLPTKQKIIENVVVGTSGLTISLSDYNVEFYKSYNIGIVPYGNYTYQISNKTLDSFTIELYNGTILTTGTIDIYLVGY